MKKLLQDWIDHCEGRENFDHSHFTSLLTNEYSEHEKKIFSYCPCSEELAKRLMRVKANGTLYNRPYLAPLKVNRGGKSDLENSLKKYLLQLRKYCQECGLDELEAVVSTTKLQYWDDYDGFDKLRQSMDTSSAVLHDELGDYIADNYQLDTKLYFTLPEAAYGLAADFELQYYLLEPVLNIDFTFDDYFEFWKLGGEYLLTADSVIYVHSNVSYLAGRVADS